MAEQWPDLGQDGAVIPPTVATVANPIRFSRTPAVYRSGPPRLGQGGQVGAIPGDVGGGTAGTQAGPGVSS
jgi:crotonobetainyl-CoA:carnitine CoA-transferase CaiB-like acyl-CoA transferase